MADAKISALTELTTPDVDDVLAVVDTSTSATKKIQLQNLLIDYEQAGDQNLGGNYLLNDQTTANLSSKGMVYSFDGVDDVVTVTDNAAIQNIFDNGGTVMAWIYPRSDGENSVGRIFDKRAASANGWDWEMLTDDGSKVGLRFLYKFSTTQGIWDTPISIPLNKWTHVALVYCNSDVANDPIIYINGISTTVTESSTPVGTRLSDAGNNLLIGNNNSGAGTFDGAVIAENALNNVEYTQAEIQEYMHGNIPYKYQGASQTEMITAQNDRDFSSGTIGNWTVYTDGNGTIAYDGTNPGGEQVAKVTVGATAGTYTGGQIATSNISSFENGKMYRMTADVYLPAGHGFTAVKLSTNSFSGTWTTVSSNNANIATTNAWQEIEFIIIAGSDVTGYITVYGNSTIAGDIFYFDNISINQIGCVADYPNYAMTSTTWYDQSGNGNDGSVSGATLLNNHGHGVDGDGSIPGIKFPATQVPSSDANTLDDYEEGTWTPTVYGSSTAGTYTVTGTAAYIKIGRLVTVTASITFSSASGGVGDLRIAGLPFNYDINTAAGTAAGLVWTSNVGFANTGAHLSIGRTGSAASDELFIVESIDNAVFDAVPITGVTTSSRIDFTLTYIAEN